MVEVVEAGEDIVHVLETPLAAELSVVHGVVDGARRLDHMVQHTGQHLLSAVMAEEFSLSTVSFHMGAVGSTVDVEPNRVSASLLLEIEGRVNERVRENRAVQIGFEAASGATGLRKASEREGLLRIISIEGLDRSACGGTHVSHTGEIGLVLLGKTEKVRDALRIEFYCGARALSELRQRLDRAAENERSLRERLAEADKARKRMSLELAELHGQRRYEESKADWSGRRVWVETVDEIDETSRVSATCFAANPGALVVLAGRLNGGVLFTAHPELGIDCGKQLKAALEVAGGRGGGTAKMAQGSVAVPEKLNEVVARLLSRGERDEGHPGEQ